MSDWYIFTFLLTYHDFVILNYSNVLQYQIPLRPDTKIISYVKMCHIKHFPTCSEYKFVSCSVYIHVFNMCIEKPKAQNSYQNPAKCHLTSLEYLSDLCIQLLFWYTNWRPLSRSLHTVAILAHSLETTPRSMHTVAILVHSLETTIQIHAYSRHLGSLTGDNSPDPCTVAILAHWRQMSTSMHTVAILAHSPETTVQIYAYSRHLGSLTGDSCPDLCIQSPSWITDYKQLPESIQHHHGSLTRYYCPMESWPAKERAIQIYAYSRHLGSLTGDNHSPDLSTQSPSWVTQWRQPFPRSMHTVAILAHKLETSNKNYA